MKMNIGMLGAYLGAKHMANEGKRMCGRRSDWATQSYPNKEAKTAQRTSICGTPSRGSMTITGGQKELRGADRNITCVNDHLLFQNYKPTDPKSSQK